MSVTLSRFKMIKKLHTKLTLIISLSLSIVLIFILIIVNIMNINSSNEEASLHLENLSDYILKEEPFNDNFDENTIIGSNDYYIVFINPLNQASILKSNIDSRYTNDQIIDYTNQIINTNIKEGRKDHLLYAVTKENNYDIIIFMDNYVTDKHILNVILFSITFGISGCLLIFILASYLSKWLIKPIEENLNKQKQFISDASHELKTPLTIISANCDLLATEIGSNKWLTYIQNETTKMSSLVNDLLNLAKADNIKEKKLNMENLSDLVTSSAMSFESVAYENHIKLEYHIEKNITYKCDAKAIRELISILLDNAIKHTKKNKQIIVSLVQNKNHIELFIKNQGDPIPKEEQDKIFDRFYRVDESHHRSDNRYGLGLSIAKSIVNSHQGQIKVTCSDGWTTFKVTL